MCADVGDRPELAAFLGQQPPIVIGLFEQPVLKVRTVDVDDVAQVAAGNHFAELQDGRVKAHVVIDGENGARQHGSAARSAQSAREFMASGFSQMQCLPAARTASAISQ